MPYYQAVALLYGHPSIRYFAPARTSTNCHNNTLSVPGVTELIRLRDHLWEEWHENQTRTVFGNIGSVDRPGGRAGCQELARSRRQGDGRQRREVRRLHGHGPHGLSRTAVRNRRSAAHGPQDLHDVDRLRGQGLE